MPEITKETVSAEVRSLIQEFSAASELVLSEDMEFEQASVSSLDVLQIVFRLEENHGVEIDTSTFDQVKTIGDIETYLFNSLNGKPKST